MTGDSCTVSPSLYETEDGMCVINAGIYVSTFSGSVEYVSCTGSTRLLQVGEDLYDCSVYRQGEYCYGENINSCNSIK